MSTGTKHPHAEALAVALAFQQEFVGRFTNWTIAGSVRRNKPEVSDIEHVVIPCPLKDMFGADLPVSDSDNGVWERLDKMLVDVAVEKAVYPDGKNRYGPRYRGVVWRGHRHEIFLADAQNYGAILAIRTGPEELSARLMAQLNERGLYRQHEGYLRYLRGPAEGAIRPVADEKEYFALCGEAWKEPEDRR